MRGEGREGESERSEGESGGESGGGGRERERERREEERERFGEGSQKEEEAPGVRERNSEREERLVKKKGGKKVRTSRQGGHRHIRQSETEVILHHPQTSVSLFKNTRLCPQAYDPPLPRADDA